MSESKRPLLERHTRWKIGRVALAVAVALLLRPRRVALLLGLGALQMGYLVAEIPNVPNHWVFAGVINATFWHAYAFAARRKGEFGVELAEFYRTWAPLVRGDPNLRSFATTSTRFPNRNMALWWSLHDGCLLLHHARSARPSR